MKTTAAKDSSRREAGLCTTTSPRTIFAKSHRMKTTTSISTEATTTTPTTMTYTTLPLDLLQYLQQQPQQ